MIWSSQPKINNKHFHLSLWVGYPATLFSWSNITALFLNKFIFLCMFGSNPSTTHKKCRFGLTHVCVYMNRECQRNPCLLQNQVLHSLHSLLWHTAKICCLNQHSALGSFCLLVDQGNPEYTQVYKNEPHRLWLDTNGYIYQNTDSLTISPGDYNIFSWLNRCELLQFTWKQCKIK